MGGGNSFNTPILYTAHKTSKIDMIFRNVNICTFFLLLEKV